MRDLRDSLPPDRHQADAPIPSQTSLTKYLLRWFLRRAVRFLAGGAGIRQFLDIGTGIPAADNTHEVAQAVAPQSRVVYVDNDPIVLTHARALLASHPAGSADYLDADLREPQAILTAAARTFDFGQPVAVMLIAVLHFVTDAQEPYRIVGTLLDVLPPGSYLALSHAAHDVAVVSDEVVDSAVANLNRSMAENLVLRGQGAVTRFFDGLDLVRPGVVQVPRWRPESAEEANQLVPGWAGVGVKR